MRFAAALVLALALPVQAEVYKWVDEKGRTHYSNTPPQSVADKAKPVEGRISVMGLDPAVRAAAERRFAALSEREVRDLQQQGPRYAALATAPGPSLGITPYEPYYSVYSDYYPAYGGYYAPAFRSRGARFMHHSRSHGLPEHRHSHRSR